MPTADVTLGDARALALNAQMLDGDVARPAGREGAAEAIERLGYVQIDTISVVQRAHHHTLWTRCPDYDPAMLHELQANDRRVFEHWAHALAVLPICDYRYYIPQMKRAREHRSIRLQSWCAEHRDVINHVLDRIHAEGPLTSKDFELPPGMKRGTWWDWKPAKRALELLFAQGDLMIKERRGFQKVYDLTERVLPSDVDTAIPSSAECGRFQVLRTLGAYGIAQEREMLGYLKLAEPPAVRQALAELVESGEVVQVAVDGMKRRLCYVSAASWKSRSIPTARRKVHLLSPFDSLIIQRQRVAWLFGFDYTLECYLPEAKRTHGYFVLPILCRDRLVGRLDPKADRSEATLIVRSLSFEPWFAVDDEFLERLGRALARFAQFNGCVSVRVEHATPAKLRGAVSRFARKALRERKHLSS